MLGAANSTVYPLQGLPSVSCVTPVHCRDDADIGYTCYFEQRTWLSRYGLANEREYLKRQRKENYLEKLVTAWHRYHVEFCRSSDHEDALQTTMLSTGMLIAWLFMKANHAERASNVVMARRCALDVSTILDFASHGRSVAQGCASVVVLGVSLDVLEDFTISVLELQSAYATMNIEWEMFREAESVWHTSPWPDNARVSVHDLLVFLHARVQHSKPPLAADHWLINWRNALLQVVVYFFECSVMDRLDSDAGVFHKLSARDSLMPSGRFRGRSALTKKQWMSTRMNSTGSSETVTRTFAGCHGVSAVIRNVSNASYTKLARCAMSQSSAISWSWDGSCHGGLDVNCGSALKIPTLDAAYLVPRVPYTQSILFLKIVCSAGLAGPYSLKVGSEVLLLVKKK